jgi:ABC-2 type transport system permease protein
MKKYISILVFSAKNQTVYMKPFIMRNLFFIIIIFVFNSLWRVIYGTDQLIAGLTITQTLWYLTFTETIELSRENLYMEIQREVKDGSIAYTLIRPYSYISFYLFSGLGKSFIKTFPVLVIGFLTAAFFTGILPGYFTVIPVGFLLIIGGIIIGLLWQIIIGLLAFWFEEVSPFFLIIQKLIFIIGGMFLPIDFFPEWLQGFSKASPFAFSAYWPAITIVNFSYENLITTICGQIIYTALLFFTAGIIFNSAKKKVHSQGG